MAFLKIENPGLAPVESYTVLGASTKSRDSSEIGEFGSGNKLAIATCLRHDIAPIIYTGRLGLRFTAVPTEIADEHVAATVSQVTVSYSGTDELTGKRRSATEPLGWVAEYGQADWREPALALREFVANAIDHATRHNESLQLDVPTPWHGVTVEVVSDAQVRAKAGYTRVFVPLSEDVARFYSQLGKWFLHFSCWKDRAADGQDAELLPKAGRNLDADTNVAVIYRKGVRVREFTSSDLPSLWDYNLHDLELDESRQVDDWRVKHECSRAMQRGSRENLVELFESYGKEQAYWEHSFDSYGLLGSSWALSTEDDETRAERQTRWTDAIVATYGEHAVLVGDDLSQADRVAKKGFKPIAVPSGLRESASHLGLRTAASVLSVDDLDGREILDAPTECAVAVVDWLWDFVVAYHMTAGKQRPHVGSFRGGMEAGAITLGFYRDNTVFLNESLAGRGPAGSPATWCDELLHAAIEEIGHYVTGATDMSRDFQEWFIRFSVALMRRRQLSN